MTTKMEEVIKAIPELVLFVGNTPGTRAEKVVNDYLVKVYWIVNIIRIDICPD